MKILTQFKRALLLLVASAAALSAQTSKEAGIPITDPLTIAKCGACHIANGSSMMRRLSYLRTTPEVWEEAIKRMVRLNGLTITPAEASQVLRYLSNNNGLAPEEAKPIFWEAEHRTFRTQEDENGVPPELQRTCNYCHTIGRVLGQRRPREEYEKLANMHMAMFPGAETGVFRPNTRTLNPDDLPATLSIGAGGGNPTLNYASVPAPESTKTPLDIALDYLAATQPLITPEWSAWKPVMRPPKLADTWVINGYQKGKGRVYGKVTVEATPAPDEFTTKIELHYASGQVETRTGKGVVYTGYSWRGRSKAAQTGSATDPNYSPVESREAMLVSRDGSTMEGRWFWGGYQEFGLDVQLIRQGSETVVTGTDRYSVPSPWTGEIHIYGGNLPSMPKTSDFDLGIGIQVIKVVHATPGEATLQISVAPSLPVAMHDVSVRGSTAVKAFAVYTKIDYIKVAPDANLARLGGTISAKQYAQFEAIAFSNGPDGIPGTADDISLGPVSANWSLEEFLSTPDDDDVNYVGTINPETGLFTPSVEGPNPKRQKASNNFPTENWGDVWVDASYKTDSAQSLKARSYLVVTIPNYIQFDQPEVSQ